MEVKGQKITREIRLFIDRDGTGTVRIPGLYIKSLCWKKRIRLTEIADLNKGHIILRPALGGID